MKHSGPGGACVVLSACPQTHAGRLARGLVDVGLAACVTRIPGALSTYRWQGRVVEEPEELLIIKTVARCLPQLEMSLRSLHPYEVPEIIALEVSAGAASYLDWLAAGCSPPKPAQGPAGT